MSVSLNNQHQSSGSYPTIFCSNLGRVDNRGLILETFEDLLAKTRNVVEEWQCNLPSISNGMICVALKYKVTKKEIEEHAFLVHQSFITHKREILAKLPDLLEKLDNKLQKYPFSSLKKISFSIRVYLPSQHQNTMLTSYCITQQFDYKQPKIQPFKYRKKTGVEQIKLPTKGHLKLTLISAADDYISSSEINDHVRSLAEGL